MKNILKVSNVSKLFGGVVANDKISINVNKGEIVGLIGPNGSGKTTLFNSIVGLHIINEGNVVFEQENITNFTVSNIAQLGLLRTFQNTKIYGAINCMKNMCISASHKNETIRSIFSQISPQVNKRAEDLYFRG